MFGQFLQTVIAICTYPITHLYFHGPWLYGYGFWEGLPRKEICSRLSRVDSHFWDDVPTACDTLIERKIAAIMAVFWFALYFHITFMLFRAVHVRVNNYLFATNKYYCCECWKSRATTGPDTDINTEGST